MQELEKRKLVEQTVIFLQHSGAYSEIGKVYHELSQWAWHNKVRIIGNGFTVFLSPPNEFDPGSALFEVCMPVSPDTKVSGKVGLKKVPAAMIAACRVKGPYDRIPAHYTEMLAWLNAEGWEITGPPREVYIKRPDARGKGDPHTFITEIQFPVGA